MARRRKRKRGADDGSPDRTRPVGAAVGLLVLAVAAFAPALGNGFVNWDDAGYIVINPLLDDLDGLKKIWFSDEAPVYYPLVFTSFWIERQLGLHEFGEGRPSDGVWGNHAINMLIHGLAGILLWRCLLGLGMPGGWAWLAAALWLVHPLQVESVVWAVERKNTLAGLFYFASALAYLRAGERMRSRAYVASLVFFVCMMLSKTAFLGLPATLLLIEWLRGRRISRAALVRVAPFVAIGALLALPMIRGEQTVVIAETLAARLMIAGRAVWFYPYKLLWPLGAVPIYPRWDTAVTAVRLLPLALALAAGAAWVVAAMRGRPWRSPAVAAVLVATAQYVTGIGPALGLVAWPHMDRSFVANHFAYVPLVGPIVLVVLGLRWLMRRVRVPHARRLAVALAALLLILLGAYSVQRSRAWRNDQTLVDHIVDVHPESPEAHALWAMNLERTDPKAAIDKLRWVVERKPRYPRARLELARMLAGYRNDVAGAIDHARAVTRMRPEFDDGHLLLARLLARAGRHDEALSALDRTSKRHAASPAVLSLRIQLLLEARRHAEALEATDRLERAVEQATRLADERAVRALVHVYRGRAKRGLGDVGGAEREFHKAREIEPRFSPERIRGQRTPAAAGEPSGVP